MSSIYDLDNKKFFSNVNSYSEYLEEIEKVEDKLWWSRVTQNNTQKAYEVYLDNYPNGIFSIKAKKKIDELIDIAMEEAKMAEIVRKAKIAEVARKEEERLAELTRRKEKARLAEITRKEKEEQLAEIARKEKEEQLAEIARKEKEELSENNTEVYIFGGMISLYLVFSFYSLGFVVGLVLVLGSIFTITLSFKISDDEEIPGFIVIIILLLNIIFLFKT